ncbi:beta-lactamase-like protein [Cubamyces lactineus]|nr:beta-lactamase-like protein [Cubamyces lactineus]
MSTPQADGAALPNPGPNQAYIEVSALEAGMMTLPMQFFIKDAAANEVKLCPSLAFSLRHVPSGAHLVFDLGLRRDTSSYPPLVQGIAEKYMPYTVPQSVDESLLKGGIDPKDVRTIVISHLHWDHIGDPAPFVNATFVVAEAGRALLETGFPTNPKSDILQSCVPSERTRFLAAAVFDTAIGPFPRAHDYFGDGSLYLIDAIGHLAGHINVLARTSAEGSWIYLGSDTAHDKRLLTGEKDVAVIVDPAGHTHCAHANKEDAVEHIRRVRTLLGMPKVDVLLAHDEEWYRRNKEGSAFLPGKIPART